MQVTIQSIPASLQEFETLAAGGRQPERICALFLCALALFDKDRDAGTAAMNLLRGPRPMTPYDCQFLRDRLRAPYRLNVLADSRPQDIEPGYLRVFLKTAGADSPRPMKLRQKASTGEWFLWEYSSILSGIRIPAAEDPWA